MTKQQQKLYDKLLKKVNEYCLGAAAEDVIAAIDALVDTYETPKVDSVLEPLQALKELKYVHDTECGEDKTVNERFALIETALKRKEELERMHTNALEKIARDRKKLKALEIIKKFAIVDNGEIYITSHEFINLDDEPIINERDSKEEYELLKEVL